MCLMIDVGTICLPCIHHTLTPMTRQSTPPKLHLTDGDKHGQAARNLLPTGDSHEEQKKYCTGTRFAKQSSGSSCRGKTFGDIQCGEMLHTRIVTQCHGCKPKCS